MSKLAFPLTTITLSAELPRRHHVRHHGSTPADARLAVQGRRRLCGFGAAEGVWGAAPHLQAHSAPLDIDARQVCVKMIYGVWGYWLSSAA